MYIILIALSSHLYLTPTAMQRVHDKQENKAEKLRGDINKRQH